jgi:hypothetical protein
LFVLQGFPTPIAYFSHIRKKKNLFA